MTKKSFIIIAVLSFIVTNVADLINAVLTNTLLGGESGFPFKDDRTTLFGGGTSNNFMFIANMTFWFLVIFTVWKLFIKITKTK